MFQGKFIPPRGIGRGRGCGSVVRTGHMPDSEQWAVVRKAPLHCSFLNCAPTEGKFRQERVPDGLRLAAFLEQGIKALRFFIAVYAKGKIDAAHGLKFVRRAVARHQERISDDDAGVDDAFL
jgi:hypothetical protein